MGIVATFNLYIVPYWCFVVWLDVVTYLHHHGSHDENEKLPWYRSVGGTAQNRGGIGSASHSFKYFPLVKLTATHKMHLTLLLAAEVRSGVIFEAA